MFITPEQSRKAWNRLHKPGEHTKTPMLAHTLKSWIGNEKTARENGFYTIARATNITRQLIKRKVIVTAGDASATFTRILKHIENNQKNLEIE